jgi:trehalose/maltose hydrolase-like predicted phosphorylase
MARPTTSPSASLVALCARSLFSLLLLHAPHTARAYLHPVPASSLGVPASNPLSNYAKHQRSVLPWATALLPKQGGNCGTNFDVPCNLTLLASICDSTPTCNAWNTNGYIFNCPGGRCDCDGGLNVCMRGQDIYDTGSDGYGCSEADTWVRVGYPAPPEWAEGIASGKVLFGSPEAGECYPPEVGNGYLATAVGWGSLSVSGLFNGGCGNVGKVRIPSPVAVNITNAVSMGGALDTINAVYRRRLLATTSKGKDVTVEQRWYASRVRRNLLVLEFQPLSPIAKGDRLDLAFDSLWAPASNGRVPPSGHVYGDGCAGGFSQDLTFLSNSTGPKGYPMVADARTNRADDDGKLFNVTVIVDLWNGTGTISLVGNGGIPATLTYLAVVASSLDTVTAGGGGDTASVEAYARGVYASASAAGASTLYSEHVAAWSALNFAGIDILPNSSDPADVARALDIATHASSSFYYLASSVRDDWFTGISPGGISSGSYSGAVFMDMDMWMMPGLLLLAPSLAQAIVEFRYASISSGTEEKIAALWGYEGTMAAWTAGYEGRLFGCCSGHGGYEDCLEQHVTGDQAWAAWEYYAATGNTTWLATRGWPILEGTATFHMSRVTNNSDGSYSVKGILPVDEWCVGSGCGCETPGVDDDAQMNAMTKLSLLKAAQAAQILGKATPATAQWAEVGAGVVLLMNETKGHHNQFTSPQCPGGWGGSHYSPTHTVCPEDVMLLTYPLGEALNTTAAVSLADAEVFIPITCRENAGMTTPIHTIVWLQLGRPDLAAAEFNRTRHAACYGPYNVRNEVDMHQDIIGGHFENTRFLTGDGGALQALLNGYGGLRILDDSLKLLQPTLPESVGQMTLRNISWRGRIFTMVIGPANTTITLSSTSTLGLGLTVSDNPGCTPLKPGEGVLLDASGPWPALVKERC